MPPAVPPQPSSPHRSHPAHRLGVLCALAAGAWLGAAEAPTKLVNSGLSPYAVSLCMVAGVFLARWTIPTLAQGTRQVFADLARNRHLIPIAILAGMLWAVANTLTVFAIRDVGLAIAFPIWNTNSLIGILWGRLLFGELKGASARNVAKVVLGASAIVAAAILLGFSTLHPGGLHASGPHATRAASGILAALGASLLWGTMYVPYRKAYLSGMNPLSFVTIFTIGELATVLLLALALDPAGAAAVLHSPRVRPMLFWLFLGGFVWVIGDIFQQYATKYLGIGRAIPLSNTNQLWGLAWGALVFGELAHADPLHRTYVVAGSVVMILGALAVSTAIATEREHASTHAALHRECDRYGLDHDFVLAAYLGVPPATSTTSTAANSTRAQAPARSRSQSRSWWDLLIVATALAVFVALGLQARIPSLPLNLHWTAALTALLVLTAATAAHRLWSQTRFE